MGCDATQLRCAVAGVFKWRSFLVAYWVESQTLRRSWNGKNLSVRFENTISSGLKGNSLTIARRLQGHFSKKNKKKQNKTESSNSEQINNQTKKKKKMQWEEIKLAKAYIKTYRGDAVGLVFGSDGSSRRLLTVWGLESRDRPRPSHGWWFSNSKHTQTKLPCGWVYIFFARVSKTNTVFLVLLLFFKANITTVFFICSMGNVRKKMNGTQKEANTKVAKKSCIWPFGQQGPSKTVAKRLKMNGWRYGKAH